LVSDEHFALLIKQLTQLNSIGEKLGKVKGVNAMTDVTGFGLLGHLTEMAEGSGLSAEIIYDGLPI
jgi:selenide,water dikinase